MTGRVVAVLLTAPAAGSTPAAATDAESTDAESTQPGSTHGGAATDAALNDAMAEDVVDMVAAMPQIEPAIVADAATAALAQAVRWPVMALHVLPATSPMRVPGMARVPVPVPVHEPLTLLAEAGADTAVVVAADAPDLPPLLLGKLFSALTTATVAVCPADGGGLVAAGAVLPPPDWLQTAGVGLDDLDALDRLRSAAPPRALHVGPGWHRVRQEPDLDRLDHGLEGWEATRALLAERSGHAVPEA